MKKIMILTVLCLIFVFSTQQAHAGTLRFGTNQSIRTIESSSLKGPKGEELYIGNIVETHYFLLGIYVKDGGYALGVKGKGDTFYPMPEGIKLKAAQAAGLLPIELPKYELGLMDYAIGYSLWLAILAIAGWAGLKRLFRKKENNAAV